MKQNKLCEILQNSYYSILEYLKCKEDYREKRNISKFEKDRYIDFMKHSNNSSMSGNYRVMVDDKDNTVKTVIYTDSGALIETRVPGSDYNRTYEGFVSSVDEEGNICRNYVAASCVLYKEDSGELMYYYETIERLQDGSFHKDYSVYQLDRKMLLNLPEEVDWRFLELSNKFMNAKSLCSPIIGK